MISRTVLKTVDFGTPSDVHETMLPRVPKLSPKTAHVASCRGLSTNSTVQGTFPAVPRRLLLLSTPRPIRHIRRNNIVVILSRIALLPVDRRPH